MGKLERVLDYRREYTRYIWKVEELQATAERATKAFSPVPSRGGTMKQEDWYVSLMEYKKFCEERIRGYKESCMELEYEIDTAIPSPQIRAVMKARYIDGQKVEEIAESQFYEPRTIYRLLKKGKSLYEKAYGSM